MPYKVGNFVFETEEEAKIAQQEEQAISYVLENLDLNQIEAVKAVYEQLRKKNMFHTVVGQSFMADLQRRILKDDREEETSRELKEQQSSFSHGPEDNSKTESNYERENTNEKSSTRKKSKKNDKKLKKYIKLTHLLTIICITLLLIIVGMFVVNSTSNSPTILNYEKSIIDKYASWETELDEREKAIYQKEQELQQKE